MNTILHMLTITCDNFVGGQDMQQPHDLRQPGRLWSQAPAISSSGLECCYFISFHFFVL